MNFSNSAFIFPGQGSQSPKMLSDYFDHQKIFCETFDEAHSILNIDFRELIENGSADNLASTEITQILLFGDRLILMLLLSLLWQAIL